MALSRPLKPEDLLQGLECPICQDHFRNPKILPCGHTMCLSPCLEQIADGKPRLRCPECRTKHDVPEGGVECFLTNVSLARLLQTPKESVPLPGCPICGETEERIKCLHCGLLVCDECRQSHTIKFRDQLLELLVSLKEDKAPAAITSCSEQKPNADASIKDAVDAAIKKVENAAEQAQEIISNKAKELISSIEDFGRIEIDNIAMWCGKTIDEMNDIVKFCDTEHVGLNQKVPTQSKMAKLRSACNMKLHAVSKSSHSLQRVVRDVNIITDLQCLEEVSRNFIRVAISHVDETTENQLNEEMDKENGDNRSVSEVAQASTPGLLCLRETPSLELCVGSSGSGATDLNQPFGVAVDPATKNIIIADEQNHRVQIFNKDGQPILRFGSRGCGQDQFNCLVGVAVTPEGLIVVTDFFNCRVMIYNKDGTLIKIFGNIGSDKGYFNRPHGVAIDRCGNIHVCDRDNNRVQVFDAIGQFKYQYNNWKSVCNAHPHQISINRQGNIAITLGLARIVVFNSEQELLSTFTITARSLCWINDDHLLISDHKDHVLKVYKVSGELVKQFGQPGNGKGQLQHPRGVTVDDEGCVYVTNRDNNTVQKFKLLE